MATSFSRVDGLQHLADYDVLDLLSSDTVALHGGTRLGGQGVTFDGGGISLNPGAKMAEMKFAVSGGAAPREAVYAIKAEGIVTAANGKTIEVNNADAKGGWCRKLPAPRGRVVEATEHAPLALAGVSQSSAIWLRRSAAKATSNSIVCTRAYAYCFASRRASR